MFMEIPAKYLIPYVGRSGKVKGHDIQIPETRLAVNTSLYARFKVG